MKLSPRNARHFFRIVTPFLAWASKETSYLNTGKDHLVFPDDLVGIWSAVWSKPDIFDKYLDEQNFDAGSEETVNMMKWKECHEHGAFFVERYTSDGTVFISLFDGQVYQVCGITEDISVTLEAIKGQCLLCTTLIPYQGKLIYDSSLAVLQPEIGEEIKPVLEQIYKEAVEKKTIITALPAKEFTKISPEQLEALKEYALKAVLEHEAEKQELEKEVDKYCRGTGSLNPGGNRWAEQTAGTSVKNQGAMGPNSVNL